MYFYFLNLFIKINRRCPWPCWSSIGNLLLIGRESPQWYVKQNHSFSSAFSCPSHISALFIWKIGLVPLGTEWGLSWRSGRSEASKKRRLLTVLCVLAWNNKYKQGKFQSSKLGVVKTIKYPSPFTGKFLMLEWYSLGGGVGSCPGSVLCPVPWWKSPRPLFALCTAVPLAGKLTAPSWFTDTRRSYKKKSQALLGFAPGWTLS